MSKPPRIRSAASARPIQAASPAGAAVVGSLRGRSGAVPTGDAPPAGWGAPASGVGGGCSTASAVGWVSGVDGSSVGDTSVGGTSVGFECSFGVLVGRGVSGAAAVGEGAASVGTASVGEGCGAPPAQTACAFALATKLCFSAI